MARLRYNGLSTTLGGTGLTTTATAVTFGAALTHSNGTAVSTLAAGDYIPLVILDSSGHESEIVWLTAYTAGATSGTITRGQEGTTGVAHSSGDKVICSPTAFDLAFHGVKVYRSAAFSMPNATVTSIPWDAEDFDTDGYHDTATNNTRLTVPTGLAGKYSVTFNVGTDATVGAARFIALIMVNGVSVHGGRTETSAASTSAPTVAVTTILDLAVGDYVEAQFYQDSTGARNFYNQYCGFSMHRIG